MGNWDIIFGRPWSLLLLAIVPLLWLISYRSLAGLGPYRRLAALILRSLVLAGLVLALAEIQFRKTSDKLTVIYLLDQSESIPADKRRAMVDYVVREVAAHRNVKREDRAGVIVFGREPLVEVPPFANDLPLVGQLESGRDLRRDATNIAAALKMAQATFPQDAAKRIVLISDGNENLGSARTVMASLAEQGIGVDVLGVEIGGGNEVALEKVVLPSNARQGQPLEIRIVLDNFSQRPASGTLTITRQVGASRTLMSESAVTLRPGKNVFTVREPQLDTTGIVTYSATFTPASGEEDRLVENNAAQGFTYIRGKGRALLIEDAEHRGEFDYLIERLRANEIEVDLMATNELFTSLAELQAYDVVILANCPRSTGESADAVSHFSDEQIQILVQNTEHLGCGLVVLGGPNSYGAGGWSNTELEKALPVDCQIRNAKVNAVGALAMVMHASELAQGNYWQKVIAIEALKALGPMDYCGVIEWGNFGGEQWLWGGAQGMLPVGPNRRMMQARINRMTPGDMPAFDPGLRLALAGLKSTNAAMKHMIVISDGDPTPPSPSVLQAFVDANIKISTVAVGAHGSIEQATLKSIADATGGNYYAVANPKALPRIFQREARRVAKPLIYEPGNIPVRTVLDHPAHGLANLPVPPVSGMILTTVKENPLVEVSLRADISQPEENSTLLATWTYGLGRVAAWTTDAGARWASAWTNWPYYDKFFTQLIRWAMRPTEAEGNFDVATEYTDGKVRVVVTALGSDNRFLNLGQLSSSVLAPDGKSFGLKLDQIAPGRYLGEFEAAAPGNYFLLVNTGAEEVEENGVKQMRVRPPLISGVTVPYSSEYNDRQTNRALLESLAAFRPKGGEPGRYVEVDLRSDTIPQILRSYDSFRSTLAKAVSIQDIWPPVLVAVAVLFFLDVFVRRVHLDWSWLAVAVQYVVRRWHAAEETAAQVEERLERLRSTKAAAAEQIDERRAAVRFQPQTDEAPQLQDVLDSTLPQSGAGKAAPRTTPTMSTEQPAEESYTERLLKAKQRAQRKPGPDDTR
jgi:uncharacterized membrane protein